MHGENRAAVVKLIADIVDRMPRSDAEAVALRIVGSLDQAGYEIRPKAGYAQIIGFDG